MTLESLGLLVILLGGLLFIIWFLEAMDRAMEAVDRAWGKAQERLKATVEHGKRRFYTAYNRWRARDWSLTAVATATAKVTAIVVCLVVLIFCYDLVMDKLRGRPDYCDAKNRHALRDICEETNGIWPFT